MKTIILKSAINNTAILFYFLQNHQWTLIWWVRIIELQTACCGM